jgi:hypothetical protein
MAKTAASRKPHGQIVAVPAPLYRETRVTTDRDGSVMDCYGFRRLGPACDPPRTVPRHINVTFRTIRPMNG